MKSTNKLRSSLRSPLAYELAVLDVLGGLKQSRLRSHGMLSWARKKVSNLRLFLMMALFFSLPQAAFAARTGVNAWEQVLDKVVRSLTGPVAYAVAVIAIVITGLIAAFADLQQGGRRFIQAACGLSIVFFAVQIVTGFLGFNGAVV